MPRKRLSLQNRGMRSGDQATVAFQTATELSAAIAAGQLDPVALTRLMLERIRLNPELNAFVAVCGEAALAEAEAAAERARAGRRRGPLDGIPVAVKDNIDVAGIATSNGFGGPPWRVPAEDAEVVRRLRAAGAVILGKLNMHEGALGATTDNPHFGPATNPHRPGHTPGGSSGGSGAAVAAGLCVAALGTDTGGSVRIPAAYCGVVGFKPSFGLVSTRGVVPLSWRLDHVGPLTRSVADARLVFETLQGFDPSCAESRPASADRDPTREIAGLRLGVLADFADEPVEPVVAAGFAEALAVLQRLGCATRSVRLAEYDRVRARRALLLQVEADAAVIHGELYRREPERFSTPMRAYLDYGGRALATQLVRAGRLIEEAALALRGAFAEVDAIVSPTTPQAAFAFNGPVPDNQNAFCVLANFAGAPAVSVPMRQTEDGLPLGLQIIAAPDRDLLALRLGEAYEAARGAPPLPPAPFGPG